MTKIDVNIGDNISFLRCLNSLKISAQIFKQIMEKQKCFDMSELELTGYAANISRYYLCPYKSD